MSPDDIWSMPTEALSDPEEVLRLIQAQDWEDSEETWAALEMAEGLYWYCNHYHGGQGSTEYRVMCQLGYHLGMLETGPQSEVARLVYSSLGGALDDERDEQ